MCVSDSERQGPPRDETGGDGGKPEGSAAAELEARYKEVDYQLRRVGVVLGWMLVLAGACVTLYLARAFIRGFFSVVTPFLAAAVLAYILDPIVTGLQRRYSLSRVWGLLVCYGCVLIVVALFLAVVAPVLYRQAVGAYANFTEEALPELRSRAVLAIRQHLPEEQRSKLSEWTDSREVDTETLRKALPGLGKALEAVSGQIRGVLSALWGGLNSAVGLGAFIVFAVVISFYFVVDFDQFGYFMRVIIPTEHEARVFDLLAKMDKAVGGFLRGQLIVCACVGTLTTVGLFILGLHTPALAKYCLLIGIAAGVANFIPYLGPILGATPAALIVLMAPETGEEITFAYRLLGVGGVVLVSAITQTVEGFVLQPYVVGTSSELPPLVVMFALLAGAQFGLGGMIVAVPVAAMARVLVKELWWDRRVRERFGEG